MSFLTPWFLLGALFIAGPIIAHLLRQATRKRVSFSAMRFLSPTPPKLDRRNRIEHPWLLLLRCLIVLLLAMAFARPFLKHDLPQISSPTLPQSVVVVLDESASMNRAGLWDAARKKINDLAASLEPQDQFVLLGSADTVTELVSRERWQQTPSGDRATLVRAVLADRQPGWGPKNLDTAIESATNEWEHMTEAANAQTRKKIVVVSDFTASARTTGLVGLTWPAGCQVDLESVAPTHPGNAGLHWLGWSFDNDTGPAVRVSLAQSAKSTTSDFQVQLRDANSGDALGEPVHVTVQPGDKQIVSVPVPKTAVNNPLRVELTGDQENYDNTVWVVRPAPREMLLEYYGSTDAKDAIHHARYYLERAVAGWKDPVVHLQNGGDTSTTATTTGNVPPPPGAEVIVVSEPQDAAAVDAIRKKLSAGAFAIVLLNDPKMVDTASALAGESGWVSSTPKSNDAMFGEIDFQHPLFSLFADPRYSDFTHIHFWHPQSVKLPDKSTAKVVARFDDELPAVIETGVGKGRVIVWGSDWEPGSSQWVLSTKFVPWLQSLFEQVAGGALHPAVAEIGDTVRITGSEAVKWRPLADTSGTFQETTPTQPGIYQLEQGGSTHLVALQVPAMASNITPLAFETWEKLGVPLKAKAVTTAAPIAAKLGEDQTGPALEARQKLWRWALVGTVLLLALESIYSLALARRNHHNATEASV